MTVVPPYIERIVPYSPGKPIEELERELGIKNAVKLASNENPFGPSPRAIEALRAAVLGIHRYPDSAGFSLRTGLCRYHGITMDEIVLGNGSNELIDLACRTYASPADHAVIGSPSFACYELGLLAANVPFDAVPLRDHLEWDVDALLAAVKPQTKLLFIANPNNPTGAYLAKAELARLMRELPEQVVLVIDEAYVDFADAADYASALELRTLRERAIILRTFSKAYGLAALRVGYAIGKSEVVSYLNRTRAPFNVGTLGHVAALAALDDRAHVTRYRESNRVERPRVAAALEAIGLRVAPSQANFVLVDTTRPGRDVYERLLRMGVIVRPMPPPIETWLRITIGTPEENDRLLGAVREFFG